MAYTVYRFVGGKQKQALCHCSTLREAYVQADKLARKARPGSTEFRILGLVGQGLLHALGTHRGGDSRAIAPATRWFTLDAPDDLPAATTGIPLVSALLAIRLLGHEHPDPFVPATPAAASMNDKRTRGSPAARDPVASQQSSGHRPTQPSGPVRQAPNPDHYIVLRRLGDQVSIVAQGIASLEAARRIADDNSRRELNKRVKYFVQAPRRTPTVAAKDGGQPDKPATTSAPATPPPPSARSIPPTAGTTRARATWQSASARPSPARFVKPKASVRYVVYRVEGEHRRLVPGVFTTRSEATAHVRSLQAQSSDRRVTYNVECHTVAAAISPPLPGSDRKRAALRKSRRAYLTSRESEERQPRASRHHDWEIENRRTDVSLAYRDEEELGIGIPAQTGHGRRSRRGPYIP